MPRHILIVDDSPAVRRGLHSLLASRSDWNICGEAADGVEAVEMAKALRPDVVLMDISMPRMDGVEATRIIRRELTDLRVIILSQNDPAIVRRQAEEVGAAAYLVKSDMARQLLPTIESVLDRQTTAAGAAIQGGKAVTPDWLAGGGELGQMIRHHAWSQTPLGPIDQWPQSLKTSVNLILNSRHPMWVGWGPEITFLYNDAYIQVLSLAKHPAALGRPCSEVWAEIWDICGPLAEKVFHEGEPSFLDDVRLLMNRGNFVEETYYSFSYSPIRDESGGVAGLFCPSTEVSPKVINARRLRTLSELSSNALVQKTTEAACASVATTLANNRDDVPFAELYLIDAESKTAYLQQTCGLPQETPNLTPASLDLESASAEPAQCFWPLAEVVRSGQSQLVSLENVEGLPLGVAQQKIRQAIVLPVTSRSESGTVGVLVAGVSPARILDAEYRTFYELVSGQIATAIQNVRAAEEERKRAEALAEIDRAKTAFFSNVSHEFRTPLTLMLGPVEDLLAKSHTNLAPAAKSQLELVNRNGARLLRLVNTLLDFSRIEAGRMQAIYQPTDLAGFTVELASVFRSATEKAGLALQLNCRKLSEPVFVDRGMWEKIVLNLISNAFKFTFEGKISVALTLTGTAAELRVQDTGVGIPAHELPRLFDRFHRIENTRSRTHEGSGIGLALVQELVKLHGGSVRVESALGEGTTFTVSVPRGSAHLPADRIGGTRTLASTAIGAAPFVEEAMRWLPDDAHDDSDEIFPGDELIPIPSPPVGQGDAASEKRPLVLVADDNSDMRQYLSRLLGERYEVRAVPDGQAALASTREQSPDLVLTDVMMPNLDGFGLLHELRSDPKTRTIPIILLSARAGEESRVEGMEHGADDYLIKPFSARELLARVQTHLEMARVRAQAAQALRESEERATVIVESIADGFMVLDEKWRITYLNNRGEEFLRPLHKTRATVSGKILWDEFPGTRGTIFEQSYRRAMTDKVTVAFEAYNAPLQRWLDVRAYPSREGISVYFLDITERKMAEQSFAADRRVLELIAVGSELPEILETLARDTEAQSDDGMLCSLLLFNQAEQRLRHGAAPSLPDGYNRAIDGVHIGPNVGSCGTAAFRQRPVFVPDIATDPLWRDHKDLAATHGLAACCSTPMFSSRGQLLGTVAMYYRQPHSPRKHDRQLIERATQLASIAIERKQAAEALRRRTEQFETLLNEAPLGVYLVDRNFRIRAMNPQALQAFGNIPNLIGRDFDDVIHILWPQAYADEIVKQFRHTLETGESYIVPERIEERLDRGVREVYEWQTNRIALPEDDYGVVCYFRDISRQVLAREEIAESEKKLRLATEAAELGIWHWYPDEDRATWDNDRNYEIFGRLRSDGPLGAADFSEKVVHPDDKQTFQHALAATLQTGARFYFQGRFYREDGSGAWVEFRGQLEHRADGSPWRVLGTTLDITQRKQFEETLLKHRERFDLVARAAKVGFWFCDLPFDTLNWDNLVKEHFWLSPDAEVTIDTFYERLHPDDRERTRQAIEHSIANDTAYDIEYRTVSPDGRQKWIRALGRTFYDANGHPKSFDGLTLDVTDRTEAEEREREITAEAVAATAKFRAVFEQTPVFAGIMALDGNIIDANQLCLEACGYRAEDVLGRPFWETPWWRLTPEAQTKIQAGTEQAAQGTPYRETLTYHWADGAERIVDLAVHPIRDHAGTILFLHPTGVDITDLKRAEENYRTLAETLDAEVRIRTQELEQRNVEVLKQAELLRHFSQRLMEIQDEERRHIARELHDSAGQILAALSMTLARVVQQAQQEEFALSKDAEESQEMVKQLNQEIRTMSYLLHPPLLDETGLAEALRWYIRGLTERNGMDIELSVAEDFGRLSREMELVLFRLVQECLTNIHRHSGSKSATIQIVRHAGNISLEVQDHGKGISPERLAEIQSKGSGVGIRGMRERVHQFHGDMKIESTSKGTKILFQFPHVEAVTRKQEDTGAPLEVAL